MIILFYGSFVLDFLVWPVSSEASTFHLFRAGSSPVNRILRLIFFLSNLTVYLYPLVHVLFLPVANGQAVSPTTLLLIAIVVTGRILSLRGSYLLHRSKGVLITSSVFQLTRNPITTGLHLSFLGLVLLFPAWWVFLMYVIMLMDIHAKIGVEENRLRKAFGSEFELYMRSTPRYLFI